MPEVLVVEYDARIGALLTDRLQRQELTVRWARSLIEGRRALGLPFDLALVDLDLANGDGLELVRDVRARNFDVIVPRSQASSPAACQTSAPVSEAPRTAGTEPAARHRSR